MAAILLSMLSIVDVYFGHRVNHIIYIGYRLFALLSVVTLCCRNPV